MGKKTGIYINLKEIIKYFPTLVTNKKYPFFLEQKTQFG